MSESRKGKKSHFWKGGITPIAILLRRSSKYSEWRQQCFIRDDFVCHKCGVKGGNLEVHHIIPFHRLLKESRICMPLFSIYDAAISYTPMWDIKNGITLCKKCHRKINSRRI